MESTVAITFSGGNNNLLVDQFVRDSYAQQLFTDCILYCRSQHNPTASSNDKNFLLKSTELSNQWTPDYSEFKCHRLILSAYSDFFKYHFLKNDNHSSSPFSLFLDIDSQTLNQILLLIYYGQVAIPRAELEKFSNFATKLGLKELGILGEHELNNVDLLLKRTLPSNQDVLGSVQQQQQTKKLKTHNNKSNTTTTTTKPSNDHHLQANPVIGSNKDHVGDECSWEQNCTNVNECSAASATTSSGFSSLCVRGKESSEVKNSSSITIGDSFDMAAAKAVMASMVASEQTTTSTTATTTATTFSSKRAGGPSPVLPERSTDDNVATAAAVAVLPPPGKKGSTNIEMFVCPVCQKQYEYKISLNKHIKNNHPNL